MVRQLIDVAFTSNTRQMLSEAGWFTEADTHDSVALCEQAKTLSADPSETKR